METLKKIKASIEEEIDKMVDCRILQMLQIYEEQKESVHKELKAQICNILKNRKGSIVITYLRSSYITGSHQYRITYYKKELFVEEEPDAFLYNMKLYFWGIQEDIDLLLRRMEKEFIQVYEWRKEEMRRFYVDKVYEKSIVLFHKILQVIGESNDTVRYYFGEEMGAVRQIEVKETRGRF